MSLNLLNPFRFASGAPAPFTSIYEAKDPLTTVQKQRLVEWFSGAGLCTQRWNTTCITGTNEFKTADGIDLGFELTTGAGTSDQGSINQNNINHYNESGAVSISSFQTLQTTLIRHRIGFSDTTTGGDLAVSDQDTNLSCNIQIMTQNGAVNRTSTCIAISANFRMLKVEMNACDATLNVCSACVSATSSCSLPVVDMQLFWNALTRTTATRTTRNRYWEAYNT